MAKGRNRKELIPERKNPGDREAEGCSPGSIEQQLDMCETGSLRGDDILYSHGRTSPANKGDPVELNEIIDENWEMDLAEEDREGAELSGDEHSSGNQGSESEDLGKKRNPSGS
jgi:hypothetical protein